MAIHGSVAVKMNNGEMRRLSDLIDGKVDEFADVVLRKARDYSPVNTGELKRTLTKRKTGANNYELRSNCGYGAYQELGTSKMPAQPYFAPAIATAINDIQTGGDWI